MLESSLLFSTASERRSFCGLSATVCLLVSPFPSHNPSCRLHLTISLALLAKKKPAAVTGGVGCRYQQFSQFRFFQYPLHRFQISILIIANSCKQLNVFVRQTQGILSNLSLLVMTWIAPLEVKSRARGEHMEDIPWLPLGHLKTAVNLTEFQGYFCHGNTRGKHSHQSWKSHCLCGQTPAC